MGEQKKLCTCCDKIKKVSKFNKQKTNKDGLSYHCRECVNVNRREYCKKWANNDKNKEKISKNRIRNRKINKLYVELLKQTLADNNIDYLKLEELMKVDDFRFKHLYARYF